MRISGNRDDPGRHWRCVAIEGWVYTRPCRMKKEDVLLRVPKIHYFRTRYREISMILVHSSEIETLKNLYFKGKKT